MWSWFPSKNFFFCITTTQETNFSVYTCLRVVSSCFSATWVGAKRILPNCLGWAFFYIFKAIKKPQIKVWELDSLARQPVPDMTAPIWLIKTAIVISKVHFAEQYWLIRELLINVRLLICSSVDQPTEKRVRKWAISLEDLVDDPQGTETRETTLYKQGLNWAAKRRNL